MKDRDKERLLFEAKKLPYVQNGSFVHTSQLLLHASKVYPENLALIGADQKITYRQLYTLAAAAASILRKQGVKPGDRVVLLSENSSNFYIAYYAIWHLGAVAVPLNTFLHHKELRYILTDAKPAVIVCSKALDALVQEALHDMLPIPVVDIQTLATQAADLPLADTDLVPALQAAGQDEVCLILYTSGTTGVPKGVMLCPRNIYTNALQGYARFASVGLDDQERFFCVLPLFHVFAQNTCIWLAAIAGAAVIIVARVDRALILQGLAHKPTLFFGVPTLYGLLCLMRTAPLDSVKMFVSGADMLPDKIRMAFALLYGRKICAGYGLTEASPVIGVNHLTGEYPTTAIGHPLVGIECEIRDGLGKALPPYSIGTIWVRGDNVMLGYYQAPEATAQVLVNGWLNTGDLGWLDKEGVLAVSGRSKDLIIHKGFNIYPAEVENVLLGHPTVFKAAVIGKEDVATGQIPVAFVAVRNKEQVSEEQLRTFCAARLAGYKIPRTIICLDDLPLNATGKIDKKKLIASHNNMF